MLTKELPLIVITGPTASGKTGLAIDLARRYHGEIICADSRTIYKGMVIGTAKPTLEERSQVPHHLLDVVEPGDIYTAADFQSDAYVAIADIRSRGKIPFLVGGTGLYIDAVVREYEWPTIKDATAPLEEETVESLQMMIKTQHISMPENTLNKRHLINALRRSSKGAARKLPRENTHVVAITTDKDTLRDRIAKRARQMFREGIIEEATQLASRYGWESEAMTGNIYPLIRNVVSGETTEQEAIDSFIVKDWQLAKRQLTWLKRYDFIRWMPLDEAGPYIETILEEVC